MTARLLALLAVAAALTGASVAGAATGDSATGSGTAADPSAPGTDYSFSFSARSGSSGESPRGSFALTNRATGTRLRGDVVCLKVEGNGATVAGRLTYVKGSAFGPPDLAVGDSFLLFAEDNGTSRSIHDDLSIFLFKDPPPSPALCEASESGPPPITRGGITIRDR